MNNNKHEPFYVSDKGHIYSLFYVELLSLDKSKLRQVIGTSLNHDIEEAKLSVKIEKTNVGIDPKNRYYLSQLEKAEKRLNELKSEKVNG